MANPPAYLPTALVRTALVAEIDDIYRRNPPSPPGKKKNSD